MEPTESSGKTSREATGRSGTASRASELDFTISGILSDSDLSLLVDGDGMPTPGLTLVFGVGKTFTLN